MPLNRMDSCAGIIINPRELIKFSHQVEYIRQRGSIDGAESLLIKNGPFALAVLCNRRKSYEEILPLDSVFKHLMTIYGKVAPQVGDSY